MRVFLLALVSLIALPALAEQVPYRLDRENSIVGFSYLFSGQPTQGTMPVRAADILLDLDRPDQSRVSATLDPTKARAGFLFATQAMKGPEVLDAARFPEIIFQSTRVRPTSGFRAEIDGDITIRDVTRPITLEAEIFRQRGTDAGDDRRLSIHLSGAVSRAAFGADGFPNFVGDTVTLDIVTRIDRVP